MNKPEYYPYVLLPEEIEKIKIEGIPVPEIQELPPFPEKPKKKFLGTIILILSIVVIVIIGLKILKIDYAYNNGIIALALLVSLVSLTATVFEILHNGKTKKQYKIAVKLYNEEKDEQEELKGKRSQAIDDNNNPRAIEAYRHDTINKYFRYSYNKIQAVQREHTVAQKRFIVFLEQYFEGKILENIRIIHEPKELDYSPDFVIKMDSPKVNIAIDIEEPYLFDGTKIVVKKNRAEESFTKRYRVTNELRWVSIVFNEEQIVTNPTQACKLIAHTIDEILLKEKYSVSFNNVDKLKRTEIPGQRELSAFIRNKHREKYLTAAGLIDGLDFDPLQLEDKKKEEELPVKETKTTDLNIVKDKKQPIDKIMEEKIPEKKKIIDFKKEKISENKKEKEIVKEQIVEKKQETEVEQLQIIKKVTDKIKSEKLKKDEKVISIDKDQPKKKLEEKEKIKKIVDTEVQKDKKSTMVAKGQLKKEVEIINKLYSKTGDTKETKVDLEKEKLEKEKTVKELLLKEKQAKEEQEREQLKKNILEKEKAEKERLEKEKLETEQSEINNLEQKRLEKKKSEQEHIDKERMAKEKKEKERQEKVRLEKERLEKEKSKQELLEKEKSEMERLEKEKSEMERLEKEKAKKERLEKELLQKKQLEKEKLEKIRLEKEQLDIEKLQKTLDERNKVEANNKLMEQYKNQIEDLVSAKDWDKLFDKCNEAIKKYPYWDWPYYRRSTLHGNKGLFNEVLEDCNKALAFNPKLADAYFNRATAKFFLKNYLDAVDDYQKSIDLKYQNSAEAYFNKGLCLQKTDYRKKAYREFLKAKNLGSIKAIEIIKQQYQKS